MGGINASITGTVMSQKERLYMTREECMRGFVPCRVGNAREIEERCERVSADQDHYGEWMIAQQRMEEQKRRDMYLQRVARRTTNSNQKGQ